MLKYTIPLFILFSNGSATGATNYQDLETIEGQVFRNAQNVLMIKMDGTGDSYQLKSSKKVTQDELEHLESGDHVIGLGRLVQSSDIVWLTDLEMVGVRKVLGQWKEYVKQKKFEFHDFTTLSVAQGSRSESMKYRLVPDKKDEWTIFLSRSSSLKIGTLRYNQKKVHINIIDLDSGQVSEKYQLHPVNKP